jgi:Flp pilus assembly protein TadD
MARVALTPPEALKRAIAAYNDGKFSEAERLCQAIITAKHNFFEALHMLAVVQTRLGRRNDALASYERALAMRPDHAAALNNRGVVLQELKRFDEALASYDKAIAVDPDYTDILYNRGSTLWELKRFDEALASYDRALAVRPGYAAALTNRGAILLTRSGKRFWVYLYPRSITGLLDGFGIAVSGQRRAKPVLFIEQPGISGLGREQDKLTDRDDSSVVSGCAALNVAYLIGETKVLAVNHALARSKLDGSSGGGHGAVHQAVRRSSCLRLSLLRSHCHSRLPERTVAA